MQTFSNTFLRNFSEVFAIYQIADICLIVYYLQMLLRLIIILFSLNLFAQEVPTNFDLKDIENLDSLDLNELENRQQIEEGQVALSDSEQPESLEEGLNEEEFKLEYGDKFGYDFFNRVPTNISPTGDLPVPNDYIVSFKDQIGIILSGARSRSYSLEVQLDGSILFPDVGLVNVAGRKLEDIKLEIKKLVSLAYTGVDVDVSIKNLSAKKITIVGAVKTPGTYLVNPFSTISSALAYAGGIEPYGSLRKINLIKPNGEKHIFDLYDLLIFGERTQDIVIGQGDTILVEATSSFVSINGEVLRPGVYEYLENDELKNMIGFALGLKGSANKNKIAISQINSNLQLVSKEITIEDNPPINQITNIDVFPINFSTNLGILVEGPLLNSGYYDPNEYKSLESLIKKLEFTNQHYPFIAILERQNYDDLEKSFLFFNTTDRSTYANVFLKENDHIIFLDQFNYADVSERDLRPETISEFNNFKLSINFENVDYIFPVYGDYRIIDIISQIGLDFQDLNLERILITEANLANSALGLNEKIQMRKNQKISLFKKSMLTISGPVSIRGEFELKNSKNLSEIIALQKFDESLFPFLGVVEKFDPITLEKRSSLFSLKDATTLDIELDNYSKVYFFSRENYLSRDVGLDQNTIDLVDSYNMSINVGNDSFNFPVYGRFSPLEIINYLGLSITNLNEDQTSYIAPVSGKNLVFNFNDAIIDSEPFHSLSFRTKTSNLIEVTIGGSVNLPGTYTVPSTTSINELYMLAGKFSDDADKSAVLFQRESVRRSQLRALRDAQQSLKEYIFNSSVGGSAQTIDANLLTMIETEIDPTDLGRIGGDFSFASENAVNTILEDGDFIFIPKKQNIVSVLGEVLNPNTIIYEKSKSYRYYLASSGGYKDFANKNGMYVIRANGEVEKIRATIFGSTRILPGDTIIVPRDLTTPNYYLPSIIGVADIISNLALTAASVNSIKN